MLTVSVWWWSCSLLMYLGESFLNIQTSDHRVLCFKYIQLYLLIIPQKTLSKALTFGNKCLTSLCIAVFLSLLPPSLHYFFHSFIFVLFLPSLKACHICAPQLNIRNDGEDRKLVTIDFIVQTVTLWSVWKALSWLHWDQSWSGITPLRLSLKDLSSPREHFCISAP